MIVFPNCKINLGLHILRKREDGYHDLQTVFYPVPLTDALESIPHPLGIDVQLSLSGTSIDAAPADNICVKAYYLLKNDFPQLPPVKLHLHKVIPTGAGLGGGSADAAFTLQLLAKQFNLPVTGQQLCDYAATLGSDCPFFIKNKPCFASGRGEVLEEIGLDLSAYRIVLINPGIHVPTGWAFSQLTPTDNRTSLKDQVTQPIETWKENLTNDFEAPIIATYPEIGALKKLMYEEGAVYAAMSGSGSTVYGLFLKELSFTPYLPTHYFYKEIN